MQLALEAIGDQGRPGFSRDIDILLMQEQQTNFSEAIIILDLLNGTNGPGGYARGFLRPEGVSSSGKMQAVIYRTNTVQLVEEVQATAIDTNIGLIRATMRYQFRPTGYDSSADFYVYNSHLRPSDTSTGRLERSNETTFIRTNSDALGEGAHVIYVGDLNLYKSSEPAFFNFTNAGPGQAFDPINAIGNWNNNPDFMSVHTQNPRINMDDRFDYQLVTGEVMDGRGFAYVTDSYWAFGNTGSHIFDTNINSGNAVAGLNAILTNYTAAQISNVFTALTNLSDHLPVVADYQLPARMGVNASALAPRAIVGAVLSNSIYVSNNAPVAVTAGADRLEYSLSGSGQVSASGGGTNRALTGADTRNFTFAASSVGTNTGSLSVSALSPQTANASFTTNFSVDVLHHAAPSFTSNSAVTTRQLDFGSQDFGASVVPASFALHNLAGASGVAWTARLDLLSVVETSDLDGVFSTALSPFANLTAGSSRSSSVTLATATRIGDFTGSYTLSFSDENLPGATVLGPLVLQVSGSVSGAFNIAVGQTRTIAEAFGGTGAVSKSGSGTLTFAGNNNYTGATAVDEGRLVHNGTNTASGVSVNSGGSLGGTGRVGSLSLGGVLAPGNAVGTLGAGNTVLSGGGAFELEMFDWNGSRGTAWDLLSVDGNLTLSNTSGSLFTLNLVSMSSSSTAGLSTNWNASQSFTNTFLSYTGSLLGGFDSSAFLINTNGFQNGGNGNFSVINVAGGLALRYTAASSVTGRFVWNATSGLISSDGGWDDAAAPTNGASIAFSGATGGTITNDSITSVAGIVFTNSAGEYRTVGNAFAIGSGGITNLSSAWQTISNNLSLAAAASINAASNAITIAGNITNDVPAQLLTMTGGSDTTVSGVISGQGNVTKSGAGSLTLGTNNTFTGTFAVNQGTARLNGTLATTTLTVGGGTLLLGAADLLANAASLNLSNGTVNFGGFSDAVTTYNQSGGVLTNGTLTAATCNLGGGTVGATLGATGTVNVTGAVTLSGFVNAALNVNSGGTLTLASANRIADNSAVTVNGGMLALGGFDETLGSLVLTNGGTLSGAGTINASSYSVSAGTISAPLGGPASFVKSGEGTATLAGNNANYNGKIDVQAGVLVAAHSNALGGGAVVLTNGGIRAASGVSVANGFTIGAPSYAVTNFTTNPFTAYWNFGTNAGSAAVTSNSSTGLSFGSVTNGNSSAMTLNNSSVSTNYAAASGDFNALSSARGGVFSNGSTHFSFAVTANEGYSLSLTNLSLGSRSTGTGPGSLALYSSLDNFAAALSSDAVSTNGIWALVTPSIAATTLTNGTVTFRIYGFGGSGTAANWRIDDLTLGGISVTSAVSVVSANGSGSLGIHEAGSAVFSGAITNHTSATLLAGEGGVVTFSGPISGGGSLTKSGAGTVILGAANTVSGAFLVESGVLRVQNAGSFGSGFVDQAGASSTIVFDAPGTVANAMSIYKVRAMQNVTLSGAKTLNNATYIVDTNVTMTDSGALTGLGGVTKQGSGTLVLTANNSFTGATAVEAGTLRLDSSTGSSLGATPSVSVAEGATLLLARGGQVNGSALVTLSGGTIRTASGVSEVFGSLNITSPSFLDFGSGTGASITFGSLAYAPSALTALTLVNFTQGNSLTIQTTSDLTGSIGTTFTSSGAGSFGGFSFNGSTFTITAIPEPSTYLAALGLLALMLWPLRRRLRVKQARGHYLERLRI
jgi:autotransporter-associated beta strand protein